MAPKKTKKPKRTVRRVKAAAPAKAAKAIKAKAIKKKAPPRRKPPAPVKKKALPKKAAKPAARVRRRERVQEDDEPRRYEQPEELIPEAKDDDLAEELGEEFLDGAISGEQTAEDVRDEEVPEEDGGPFVLTTGRTEFGYGTDASNPSDAEVEAFPTTRRNR